MSLTDLTRALTGDAEHPVLTFERRYRTSPDDLWSALTDPNRTPRWLGQIEGEPRAVGDVAIIRMDPADPDDAATVDVRLCERPRRLVVGWKWAGERASVVEATIRSEGEQSALTLTHRLDEAAETVAYGSGWEALLALLARDLGGAGDAAADAPERWTRMADGVLECEIVLEAPPADVWAAIATAEGMRRWWWTQWSDTSITADVQLGGAYDVAVPSQGIALSGRFVTVEPEHSLAFTWVWTDADGSTTDEACEYRLRPEGTGTLLRVRHSGPWSSSQPSADYRQGWEFVLAELGRVLVNS